MTISCHLSNLAYLPSSLATNTLRLVRKSLASMRSKQYQVVAVVGRLDSARQREAKKVRTDDLLPPAPSCSPQVIVSRRIPE